MGVGCYRVDLFEQGDGLADLLQVGGAAVAGVQVIVDAGSPTWRQVSVEVVTDESTRSRQARSSGGGVSRGRGSPSILSPVAAARASRASTSAGVAWAARVAGSATWRGQHWCRR